MKLNPGETRPGTQEDIEALEFRCGVAAQALAGIDPSDMHRFYENLMLLNMFVKQLSNSRAQRHFHADRRNHDEDRSS